MIILKINNNRDFEAMKAEGYFNAQYKVILLHQLILVVKKMKYKIFMKEDAASHLFFMLFFERLLFKLIFFTFNNIYLYW